MTRSILMMALFMSGCSHQAKSKKDLVEIHTSKTIRMGGSTQVETCTTRIESDHKEQPPTQPKKEKKKGEFRI